MLYTFVTLITYVKNLFIFYPFMEVKMHKFESKSEPLFILTFSFFIFQDFIASKIGLLHTQKVVWQGGIVHIITMLITVH